MSAETRIIFNQFDRLQCGGCQGFDLLQVGVQHSTDGFIQPIHHCQNDLCELYESGQVITERPMTPEQWERLVPEWVKAQRAYPHIIRTDGVHTFIEAVILRED